ncbi:MAG TPA: isochorismatase family protein [Dongiaceae bacterium]
MEAVAQHRKNGLAERARSCLLVIDVQQYFLTKLALQEREPLVRRMAWLMQVARLLEIPVIATAEDIARNGTLVPGLMTELPAGAEVFDKMVFGLCAQPDIRAAVDSVAAKGRDQFVLIGLETDVCISHSAFGLAEAGYRPFVIDDACASPAPHHEHGLRRLRDAGIAVTSLKGIYYEWLRDLETLGRLRKQMNEPLPPGLTL